MKNIKAILLVLCMLYALGIGAATPTISKKFNKTPLKEVLQYIEKKSGYTILYNPNEVNEEKLITTTFKDAKISSAVKRVVGKNYDVVTKKNLITIKPKPVPEKKQAVLSPLPTTHYTIITNDSLRNMNIDSIRATTHYAYVERLDSQMTIATKQVQQPAAVQPEPLHAHESHRLIGGVGAGYGTVIQQGNIAATAGLRYGYFFNEHWGLSAGVAADYYSGSYAITTERDYPDWTDTDGEPCTLQWRSHNVVEKEHLLTLNIPIMAEMEYILSPRGGIYAALGASVGLPVVRSYSTSGELIRQGYYPKWNMTIDDAVDYYHTTDLPAGKMGLRAVSATLQAEAGYLLPLKNNVSLRLGVYAKYIVNNLATSTAGSYCTDEGQYFPTNYAGAVSTTNVAAHPWQVGLAVAVAWKKPAKTQPRPTVYETIAVPDTTWNVVTHIDTLVSVTYDTIMHPVKAIQQLQETSIIWFDLGDTNPKLDPIDMLDKLAVILIANPEQTIQINGHTCDQGSRAYNEKLSIQRAQAVANLLIEKGVNPQQLTIQGFGSSTPYYSKSHDRYLDRRVEIVPIVK